jgi:hypothetical protein
MQDGGKSLRDPSSLNDCRLCPWRIPDRIASPRSDVHDTRCIASVVC